MSQGLAAREGIFLIYDRVKEKTVRSRGCLNFRVIGVLVRSFTGSSSNARERVHVDAGSPRVQQFLQTTIFAKLVFNTFAWFS